MKRAMATVVRAMATATKRVRARAKAARGMTTAMKRARAIAVIGTAAAIRVAGNKEGDGEGAREGGMIW